MNSQHRYIYWSLTIDPQNTGNYITLLYVSEIPHENARIPNLLKTVLIRVRKRVRAENVLEFVDNIGGLVEAGTSILSSVGSLPSSILSFAYSSLKFADFAQRLEETWPAGENRSLKVSDLQSDFWSATRLCFVPENLLRPETPDGREFVNLFPVPESWGFANGYDIMAEGQDFLKLTNPRSLL